MTEVEAEVPQASNHTETTCDTPIESNAQIISNEKEEAGSPMVADANRNGEDKQKNVPISAHQREPRDQDSSRVKEAKHYNNRDRNSYGSSARKFNSPKKYENHNKFDPASLSETDDPIAIRKQVCWQTDKITVIFC